MGQVAGTFGIIIMQPAIPVAFRQSSFHSLHCSHNQAKPSPIAVFVLATTVISPVCPPPPPHFFYPVAICIPHPTGNCPAKLPLRCWRFSLPFSQRIALGHMAGHNPHTHPLEMLYRLHQSKWPEKGGTALMTLQTNESVGSLMALPIN